MYKHIVVIIHIITYYDVYSQSNSVINDTEKVI